MENQMNEKYSMNVRRYLPDAIPVDSIIREYFMVTVGSFVVTIEGILSEDSNKKVWNIDFDSLETTRSLQLLVEYIVKNYSPDIPIDNSDIITQFRDAVVEIESSRMPRRLKEQNWKVLVRLRSHFTFEFRRHDIN